MRSRSKRPIRVFFSELSGRFYASAHYKVTLAEDGTAELITITGEKFDVTDDIARAIKQHDLEFTPISPPDPDTDPPA